MHKAGKVHGMGNGIGDLQMTAPTKRNQVVEIVVGFPVVLDSSISTAGLPTVAVNVMGIKVKALGIIAELAHKVVSHLCSLCWPLRSFTAHLIPASLATLQAGRCAWSSKLAAMTAKTGFSPPLIDGHPVPDISLAALGATDVTAVLQGFAATDAQSFSLPFKAKPILCIGRLGDASLAALSARLGLSFMTAIAFWHDCLLTIQYYTSRKNAISWCYIAAVHRS